MNATDTKKCTKCHRVLPLTAFGKLGRNKDGLQYWCRQCCAANQLEWRSAHRQELGEKQKARYRANPLLSKVWRQNNREHVLLLRREWYARNAEMVKAKNAAWIKANPEKYRQMTRAWFLSNISAAHASNKAWRQQHPEAQRERCRSWIANNPERSRALRTAGHARRKQRLSVVICERIDPFEIFDRDKWRCRLCKVRTPKELRGTHEPNAPVIDHIIPLALGGPHTRANLQCLCFKCNASKAAKYEGQLAFM